jgi:Matrixin
VFTHITVAPQEILKGEIGDGDFTVKQLGGTVGHLRSWLEGSPGFLVGEKVLLFLDTNQDGSAGVAHLYQGKFSLFTDHEMGKEFAYREDTPDGVHLRSETKTARAQTEATANNQFHEVTALKAQIHAALTRVSPREQRAAVAPFPLLQIPPGSLSESQEGFVLIGFPPIRWFEPDSGLPVVISLNPSDNTFPGGEDQVTAGLQAWNTVNQSTFRYQKGVITEAEGFTADGVNAISFNDPLSQLPDPVNCGGILAAVLHTIVSDESRTLHQQTFNRILESDLVFANGWENCVAFKNPANVEEVATHEIGHVLGLGHSHNPEATMSPFAHFDGRGSVLHPDDESGVAFLYPDASFPPCTYKVSPAKRSVSGLAGTGSIGVSTRPGCGWTAVSTVPWIIITEGTSGSGKDEVVYTVIANTARTARRGSLLIAGKTVKIKQKGVKQPKTRVPPFSPG